ncbi:hypothetical protein AB1Y20_009995 [Prymnesium parvum]|uniref:Translation initiation factor IF-1, chloroplastic n=1 Tax=Prymnesium parvum TaxID=97485 RepID=A0AB34K626_PRYPA
MPSSLTVLALLCTSAEGWVLPATPVHSRGGALTSQHVAAADDIASTCRTTTPMMQRGPKPSKKDVLELEGVVLEALPSATFRVQLDDTEQVILAHVSGKIRKNFIKILVGDHVTCEISPYDLTKGRITFRRR